MLPTQSVMDNFYLFSPHLGQNNGIKPVINYSGDSHMKTILLFKRPYCKVLHLGSNIQELKFLGLFPGDISRNKVI